MWVSTPSRFSGSEKSVPLDLECRIKILLSVSVSFCRSFLDEAGVDDVEGSHTLRFAIQ